MGLSRAISRSIGIEDPKIITIDSGQDGDIRCDLIDSKDGYVGSSRKWYDTESVFDELPETWSLLVINRADEPACNSGILGNIDLIRRSAKIALTGIDDPIQHGLALRVAQQCRGFIRVAEIENLDGEIANAAIIQPAQNISTPEALEYPSIAGILPKGMEIEGPKGVANDYWEITKRVEGGQANWLPNLRISIVIPLYNRREMLGRTLAMISHQTYPLELIEVVVADDGSGDDPISMIEAFQDKMEIKYVRQADLGYRLSEVRNLGIRSAMNEFVILLDCDMAPIPTMVETYARYLGVNRRALFCGHRRYVDANSISVESLVESPRQMLRLPDIETMNEKMKRDGHVLDWRMPMYRESDNLRFEKYPFRAVCGGNIGFHKSLFERAGEFDEEFRAWGKEDTEWGFRVWNRGDYIVPLYEACGLHMEPPGGRNETDRELGLKEVMPTFIDRVPVMYRGDEDGFAHSVPLVSIYIPAYNAEDSIVDAVQSALDQTFEDIEVCVAVDGSRDGTLKQLERHFIDNPRVRWVFQENQGIGGSSNTAVQLCRGVFIGQLDSDDLLLPEAVEVMLEEIQKDTRIGVVYGSFQKETPDGEFLEDGYDWPEYTREKLMFGCIVHHFRMFRARDWWRTEGFAVDMKNAVDYDMFLKLSEVTEMKHVREWSYVYRIHDESTSISESSLQKINHKIAIERSLYRRGLADSWEVRQESDSGSRKVSFVKKSDNRAEENPLTPFARMDAMMKGIAPPVVKELAKREATKRDWSAFFFPTERVEERLRAVANSKGIVVPEEMFAEIAKKYSNDLWTAFEVLEDLE